MKTKIIYGRKHEITNTTRDRVASIIIIITQRVYGNGEKEFVLINTFFKHVLKNFGSLTAKTFTTIN